ncbi:MAG: 16S rRNA (cytosine(1402)-N(4))-methyltransferase RsmH [Desulfomonile sp.]|nr:16S rRNA (cytosine(1402)-N(4))-methyltransferase RsmH [Desulfomonile sp.]
MHVPVLLHEMLDALRPRSGGTYLDGTLGAGGYAEAILTASEPDGIVVGLDLDSAAVERAGQRLARFGTRFTGRHAGFQDAPDVLAELGIDRVDGAVLDLGLSSDQLEDPERGFSFALEGPLDMRFDTGSGPALSEFLNTVDAKELERIIAEYGEERYSRRIARGLVEARCRGTLGTTADLAGLVARLVPRREARIHPATRTFQALRIAVNRELDNIERGLAKIPRLLKPGGRLCVVSYHSLEDRLVKRSFQEKKKDPLNWAVVTPRPVRPSADEVHRNPRARSAKMRVLEAATTLRQEP